MMMKNHLNHALLRRALLALALLAGAQASAWANCGSAVCLLNTDWDMQGMSSAESGPRFDARFESVKQNKLREGTQVVGPDAVTEDVVPLKTVDRNLLLSLDYPLNQRWGISAKLPLMHRSHTQLTRNPDGSGTTDEVKLNGLGDLSLVGRYVLFRDADVKTGGQVAGLSLGIKLPTGRHDVQAPSGELVEPGLQPGTGTTDMIAGVYYNQQSINSGWGYSLHGKYQAALNSRNDYKPGAKLALDAVLRYEASSALAWQLQANALQTAQSSGARAEPANTGGTLVTLSPGLAYALGKRVKLYAFYQRPIYQRVNGVQLSTTDAFAMGLSTHF